MTSDSPEAIETATSVDDVTPDVAPGSDADTGVDESLQAALTSLRDAADSLEAMPLADARVAAAEQIADAAASLDEQIGQIARSDDN